MADKYVPEDIILRILAKLPTKPLLQFTCVSKHWNRLISDPNFMKWRSRRMIFLSLYPFHAIDNNVPVGDSANSILTLRSPPVEDKNVQVVGTINGIVLLVVGTNRPDMILYNPLTAAIMNVPNPPSHCSFNYYFNAYGFGYGTTPDDLKIVIISETQRYDLRYCDAFGFMTKSWNKPLELIGNYNFDCGYKGVFVSGFLYWNVSVTDENRIYKGRVLVALDVKAMVFTEIRHSVRPLSVYRLGTLKGRLCMICYGTDGVYLELWVMNKHGLRISFSKVCELPSLNRSLISLYIQSSTYRMMCILDDGKIVLLKNHTHELMIYDMLNDSYKTVTNLANKSWLGYEAIEYVESCVSPSLLMTH